MTKPVERKGYLQPPATDEWATPMSLFREIEHRWGPFDLDPCATPENAKAKAFYTKKDDGLFQDWFGRVYVNPPYGRGLDRWLGRAYLETRAADHPPHATVSRVVLLLPSKTDLGWWHDWVQGKADHVEFIRGRVRYVGPSGKRYNAPFASCVVVYERRLAPELAQGRVF